MNLRLTALIDATRARYGPPVSGVPLIRNVAISGSALRDIGVAARIASAAAAAPPPGASGGEGELAMLAPGSGAVH